MKTTEKNAHAVQGTASKAKEVRIENRPSLTAKEAKKDETAKDQTPAQSPQTPANETAGAKTVQPAAEVNQPANTVQQPEAEGLKKEEPKAQTEQIKQPRNVEATIKEVETLHRRSIQRANLITRKKQLEAFEVALTQESDELNDNPFQGCKLIIEDDKRRQFITTTPGLVRLVAQFIYEACDKKQAEIEAGIVFPNA